MQCAFTAVYTFDQLHRQNISNNPGLRWDVIDDYIFNSYLRGAMPSKRVVIGISSSGSGSSSTRNYNCYTCKEPGHFLANCPQKYNFRPYGSSGANSTLSSVNSRSVGDSTNDWRATHPVIFPIDSHCGLLWKNTSFL